MPARCLPTQNGEAQRPRLTSEVRKMKLIRLIIFWTICCITMTLIGCGDEDSLPINEDIETEVDIFTKREWAIIQRLSPLPATPPLNPTNRVADDPQAAKLGQMLFFDERLSKDGTVACATCHSPFHGFADVEATSLGAGRGTRNAPTLLNVVYNKWQFWDGRSDSLWSQALIALEGEKEQAGTRLQYAYLIKRLYQDDYEKVFGPLPNLEDSLTICPKLIRLVLTPFLPILVRLMENRVIVSRGSV